MGLFNAIGNIFNTKQYENPVAKVVNLGLTALVHPIGFLTNTEKAYEKTAKESTGQLVIGGASNALLAVAPFTGAIRGGITKAISSAFIKAPIKSTAIGLIGAGALVSSPKIAKKAVDVVAGAPENLFKTGEVVGGIVEKGGNILTDLEGKDVRNIATALGAGAIIGTGAVVAYDYLKDKNAEKGVFVGESEVISNANAPPTDLGTPTIAPERPTTNLTTTRKRYRRSKTKESPNINQRVNVLINNRSVGSQTQNRRYLKVGNYELL